MVPLDLWVRTSASRPHYEAADCHPQAAWRFALYNHADQADIGRKSLQLFRPMSA